MSSPLKKHAPLVLVALGGIATLLPFVHVKVTAGAIGPELARLAPVGTHNTWSFGGGAAFLALLLGIGALPALAIQIWRARRLFFVPLTLVAAFASFIAYFVARGTFVTKHLDAGVSVVFKPGVGFMALMAAFAGLVAIGLWGAVRPDRAGVA